jgi:hypothetical protein
LRVACCECHLLLIEQTADGTVNDRDRWSSEQFHRVFRQSKSAYAQPRPRALRAGLAGPLTMQALL